MVCPSPTIPIFRHRNSTRRSVSCATRDVLHPSLAVPTFGRTWATRRRLRICASFAGCVTVSRLSRTIIQEPRRSPSKRSLTVTDNSYASEEFYGARCRLVVYPSLTVLTVGRTRATRRRLRIWVSFAGCVTASQADQGRGARSGTKVVWNRLRFRDRICPGHGLQISGVDFCGWPSKRGNRCNWSGQPLNVNIKCNVQFINCSGMFRVKLLFIIMHWY